MATDEEKMFAGSLIQQFKDRRNELGYTQLELDHKIGMTDGYVAKWESGDRKPTMFFAFMWAQALNCKIVLVPDENTDMEG